MGQGFLRMKTLGRCTVLKDTEHAHCNRIVHLDLGPARWLSEYGNSSHQLSSDLYKHAVACPSTTQINYIYLPHTVYIWTHVCMRVHMCLYTYTNTWYVLKLNLMAIPACTPELSQEQVCGTCLGPGMGSVVQHKHRISE